MTLPTYIHRPERYAPIEIQGKGWLYKIQFTRDCTREEVEMLVGTDFHGQKIKEVFGYWSKFQNEGSEVGIFVDEPI